MVNIYGSTTRYGVCWIQSCLIHRAELYLQVETSDHDKNEYVALFQQVQYPEVMKV